MKIGIVGMGRVGRAVAFATVVKGLASELVLVGRTAQSCAGDALDLRHASCFTTPATVSSGGVDDTAESDLIVITASASSFTLGADRRQSFAANAELFRTIVPKLARLSPRAVFVVVTNPVELLTKIAHAASGLPAAQFIGTGTLVDTVRLRATIAERCGVHPADIRIYVLGEHGDEQVAVISSASAGGAPLDLDPHALTSLAAEARDAGYAVARVKGYTSDAIALATMMIVEAVARDTHSVLPVSTLVQSYYGVGDTFLSVPAIVGRAGVIRTLNVSMNDDEANRFRRAANVLNTFERSIAEKMS